MPVQRCTGGCYFGSAQGRAVHIVGTRFVGRSLTDHGLTTNQCGLAFRLHRLRFGGGNGGIHSVGIVTIHHANHVPTIGFKAFGRIVGKPAFNMAIDGDAVVVVHRHQFGQAQGAGQRTGLVADAFHHASIAQESVGEMVHDGELLAALRPVELGGQQLLGQCHSHRIGDALAQGAGGGFNAGGDVHFWVTRRLAVQLTEFFDLVHRQVVTCQVQQGIDQHGAVSVGQHKAVTVWPQRVGRVVAQVAVPQNLGHLSHAHGRTWVAGFSGLHGVHGQEADRVGHAIGHVLAGCVAHAYASFKPDPWRAFFALSCARQRA